MQIGRAAAMVLTKETNHKAKIIIGKDTRISGDILESALVAGICSVGADAHILGVVPTPAVAMLGSLLQIKPVLTIQGEKLDTCSKARGMKAAFRIMVEHLKEEKETRFKEYADKGELAAAVAYTYMSEEEIQQWLDKLQAEFPDLPVCSAPLTMSIGCHIGPGALGVGLIHVHR